MITLAVAATAGATAATGDGPGFGAGNGETPVTENTEAIEGLDTGAPRPAGTADQLGLRPGEVAIGLIRGPAAPPLRVGDLVSLLGVSADGGGRASVEVLGRGRIVAVDDGHAALAVDPATAATVIERRAIGTVELALLGPGG